MCGRREVEKNHPEIAAKKGEMDFSLVRKIARQLPDNIIVQLHNNGEPLMYSRFGEAVRAFKGKITNIVTNGKWLIKKCNEIVDNLDTMTISVFEGDTEADEQFDTIKKFIERKQNRKPFTILRVNGEVDVKNYLDLKLPMTGRYIHDPMGNFGYKIRPALPDTAICTDFMTRLAISFDGKVSTCCNFDPSGLAIIGDVKRQTLYDIWNSDKRKEWMKSHILGRRNEIPLCSTCQYWGVPTSKPIA